jgi:pimeloyl-ACP methyl ester carboxylesterase
MAAVAANGIQIEYETFGSATDPALLLVMGLGAQMIAWDDEFCDQLASRGFFVIRYDNRDTGLSTKFGEAGVPDIAAGPQPPAYSLDDMADDAAGLLDALGIASAHIVGVSMGGMISQLMAIRHPSHVASLTSIMSSAGGDTMVPPRPEALEALMAPPARTKEEAIEQGVRTWRIIGGKGFPFDEARHRESTARAWDRMNYPDGMARQMAAIMAGPGRVEALRTLDVPALVIHGSDDSLLPYENGRITADAIPGADWLLVEGMGHDLPQGAWTRIIDAVVSLTTKAAAGKATT